MFRMAQTRLWPINQKPNFDKPQWCEGAQLFALHLSLEAINHPRLGEIKPIALSAWLELVLFNQEVELLILDQVGFMRLRDRKPYIMRQDSILWQGNPIHLSLTAVALRHSLNNGETIAPFILTSSGLLYFEQPFVIIGGDEPRVATEPKPKPRYRTAHAKPPKQLDELQELSKM